MNYSVIPITNFKREAKRLIKKFPSLKQELILLEDTLNNNPTLGTKLAKNCFKIRLAIASKNKGKSGEARIITHVHVYGKTVFLLSIYDKIEREDMDEKELNLLLQELPL